ncbi:hypothetical protein T4C_9014 [Trichinella pseudospiralis]|uniref:Uncharacterized protein n=1 Tax=Trichinella pseudospiralis TaxID=6337 RepID=A0A0V1JKI4_TRIPS|nr:hypothetical protein T4C_9014 [Trichinella pseudospiralis]
MPRAIVCTLFALRDDRRRLRLRQNFKKFQKFLIFQKFCPRALPPGYAAGLSSVDQLWDSDHPVKAGIMSLLSLWLSSSRILRTISCQVWDRYPDTVKVGINSALSNQNGITCGMENFLLIERDYVDQVSFGLQISWYLIHSMRSKGGKKKATSAVVTMWCVQKFHPKVQKLKAFLIAHCERITPEMQKDESTPQATPQAKFQKFSEFSEFFRNLAPGVAPGYAAGLNEWNVKKEGMTKKLLLAIDYVSRSALGLIIMAPSVVRYQQIPHKVQYEIAILPPSKFELSALYRINIVLELEW